jgi:hypothetical protein
MRIKSAAAIVAKKKMIDRQVQIAKKLGLKPDVIGLVPKGASGLGHILSTYQAVKEGEGPWYNPGSEHNEKHRTGFWPDLSQFDPAIIEKVKRLNGMSQYEVEHMKLNLLQPLIDKAKKGQNVIAPSPAGPPPEPAEAADAALAQSTAGKAVLAAEKTYDAAASAVTGSIGIVSWILDHKKTLLIGGVAVGLGIVALMAWPYISAARAGGKALQRRLESA